MVEPAAAMGPPSPDSRAQARAADRSSEARSPADRGSEFIVARLDPQIAWYGAHSRFGRLWYHGLKIVTIVSAGAIPVLAAASIPPIVSAVLGAVILGIEGLQQLFKYHETWISYRSTAEDLKREKSLFLAGAGPYRLSRDAAALLVERVESRIATETNAWRQLQEELLAAESRASGTTATG